MTGNAIVDLALRSNDNLDAALRIGDQSQRIRERVVVAILTEVRRLLGQWVQQHAGDWELKDAWEGGNWIKKPSEKWLPIVLRRQGWPSVFGAALVADEKGPSKVFVGIWAPTQETWDNDPGSVKWYGKQTAS